MNSYRAIAHMILGCSLAVGDESKSELPAPLSRTEAQAMVVAEMHLAETRDKARLQSLSGTPASSVTMNVRDTGKVVMRRTASKPWTAPRAGSAAMTSPRTGDQVEEAQDESIRHRTLSLSATVFDGKITELVWREQGECFIAISNVNFNYLSPVTGFKARETEWSAFFFVDNVDTGEETRMARSAAEEGCEYVPRTAPDHVILASDRPEYVIYAENPADVPPEMIEALDALHEHYAANEAELKTAWQRQQALNEARRAWMEANPPQPRDTVINFWPVRSRFHGK